MARNDILKVGLISYFLFIPLNCITFGTFGSGYKYISVAIFLIFFFGVVCKKILTVNKPIKLLFIYLFYTFLSTAWSQNFERSISAFTGMLEVAVLILLIQNFTFSARAKKCVDCSIIFSGCVFLFLLFFMSEKQIYTDRWMISFGEIGKIDPNEWCCYMIAPAVIALFYIFSKESNAIIKILLAFFELLTFVGVFLSGSRGGLVSVAVAVLAGFLYLIRKRPKLIVVALLLLASFLLVFKFWILPKLPEALLSRFYIENFLYSSGSGRTSIWTEILTNLKDNPLRLIFGYGIFGASDVVNVAHNQYIQVLLDNGLIGLSLYLGFLVSLYKQSRKRSYAPAFCLFGIQTALLFLSGYAWLKAIWATYLFCFLEFEPELQAENVWG